jgi:hypothetical protein
MGPRQPPDKRHAAAYEAIFQRPGPSHHVSSQSFPRFPSQPPPNFLPPHLQQHDRRTSLASFSSGYSHNGYHPAQPQIQSGAFRQPYLPPPGQGQHLSPGPNPYEGLYPPPGAPRARSFISSTQSPGIIAPQPDEPPESHPHGLTPAQAYQAQVFDNGASGPPPDWNRYRTSPGPPDRQIHSLPNSQNGTPVSRNQQHQIPPRLGVNLDHDDGRLRIDFGGSNGTSSDDGSSELPWARNEYTGTSRVFPLF